jgi:hypothetical protein
MSGVIDLLIVQGVLGACDVIWHHEWKERLPHRWGARREQLIHGARELQYAVFFIGIAWWEWQGTLAWLPVFVVGIELILTGWDFVEEDRTRRLCPTERIAHLILSMNGGIYLAWSAPIWHQWAASPTGLIAVSYGMRSWALTVLALGVCLWGIRDLLSGWRLFRAPRHSAPIARALEV